MRWSAERRAAALLALALLLAAGCGGDDDPAPSAPRAGDVTIVQGTSPNIEGLSIGLASIADGGVANFQVAGDGVTNTRLHGPAGARLNASGYTIEIIRVEDGADGGSATVRVTPPD